MRVVSLPPLLPTARNGVDTAPRGGGGGSVGATVVGGTVLVGGNVVVVEVVVVVLAVVGTTVVVVAFVVLGAAVVGAFVGTMGALVDSMDTVAADPLSTDESLHAAASRARAVTVATETFARATALRNDRMSEA